MKKVSEQIQLYMDNLALNGYFNGAVLVASKGNILFKKGYGFSSFQYQKENTTDTKFLIGSLTKAFTGMAILQLYEMGKLDLDTPISDIFPDFPNGQAITIHHLLTHSSGIADFHRHLFSIRLVFIMSHDSTIWEMIYAARRG